MYYERMYSHSPRKLLDLTSLWQRFALYECSACRPLAQPRARYMRSVMLSGSTLRETVEDEEDETPPRITSEREPY